MQLYIWEAPFIWMSGVDVCSLRRLIVMIESNVRGHGPTAGCAQIKNNKFPPPKSYIFI